MRQDLFMLSCFLLVVNGVESKTVSIREGQEAKIQCSHTLAGSNDKYFCRVPCTDKHVLITSNQGVSGRFSLVDHGSGKFTVTISKVRLSDSGTYYCGVDRTVKDTFTEVTLKVLAEIPLPEHTTVKLPETTADHKEEDGADDKDEKESYSQTPQPEKRTDDTSPQAEKSSNLVYIGAGLAAVVFVLVISLLMLCTQKTRGRKSLAGQKPNTGSRSIDQHPQVQCDYAEITISPGRPTPTHAPPPSTDSSAIYSNFPPPSNQNPDSVVYSLCKLGGASEREGSVLYSTINL